MAFVYRSKLKSIFCQNGEHELGPGYYFKESEDTNINKAKSNKVPFFSGSPRVKEKKLNNNPGPGAYYSDLQFNKIFKKSQNFIYSNNSNFQEKEKKENLNFDVIYQALENEKVMNQLDPIQIFVDDQFEKLGFMSKNKRFKENQFIDLPGPGAYFRAKSKSAKLKKPENEISNLKKAYLAANNKINVETIPSKNHAFGYDYNENGDLIRNEDPNKEKKFQGEKYSKVGPGDYELVKPNQWTKKGTVQWEKNMSKTQNSFFERKIKSNNSKYRNKNNNNDKSQNRSRSPPGDKKNAIFLFNQSSNNLNINQPENNVYNQGLDLQIHTVNNNCNNSAIGSTDSRENRHYTNLESKTFYNFSKGKNLRNFSSKKVTNCRALSSNKLKINLNNTFNHNRDQPNHISTCSSNRDSFKIHNFYDKQGLQDFKKYSKLSYSLELKSKENNFVSIETDEMIKYFKDKNKKRKEILLMNHRNKLFNRSYLLRGKAKDNNPGPGYYFEERIFSGFKPAQLPEEKQTFGSNSQRFPILKTMESIGPGAYFKEEFKLDKIKQKAHKEKTMIPQMEKIKKYKPVKIEHYNFPGPAEYEPEKIFKKRVQTAGNFGSNEPRFKKQNNNEPIANVGPGSYISQENWIKPDSNKKLSENTLNKLLIKPNSATSRVLKGLNTFSKDLESNILNTVNKSKPKVETQKFATPGVGSYNPEAVYTLEYKVAKNCSKNSLVEAPFNSTKTRPRFEKVREFSPSIIGPGLYHKYESKKSGQVYPPFRNSDKRFKESKSLYKTNPGQYDPSSYFEWNKKTFNILYL